MPAARRPLTVDRGGTFDEVFSWLDDNGDPEQIGGVYAASMHVIDGISGEPLLTLSSEAGDSIEIEPGGATGDLYVRVEADDTYVVRRTAMYLLQLIHLGNGSVVDLAYGPVRVGWRGAS